MRYHYPFDMFKIDTSMRTFILSSVVVLLVIVGYTAGYLHDRNRYLMMDDTTVLDSHTGTVYMLHSNGVLLRHLDGRVENRKMTTTKSSSSRSNSTIEDEVTNKPTESTPRKYGTTRNVPW